MNSEIYKMAIGAVLRHFFSIAAGLLGSYGVNEAMQGQLVEATVILTVSLIFGGGSILWSYLQKRFQIRLSFEALNAPPQTPFDAVQLKTAEKTVGTKY